MFPAFLTPWAFFGLLGIPALVAIYYLRTRSRPQIISSLLLWRDPKEVKTGGLRFEALRTPLLFLLELLAILLLVLAAANPWLETLEGRHKLVLVLDDSYSMTAGGDKSSRSLALKNLENELLNRSRSRMHIILAGNLPQELKTPGWGTSLPSYLANNWHCRSSKANLKDAVGLAAEIGGVDSLILVVTDHPPPFELEKGRVRWWSLGEPRSNFAIVNAGRSQFEKTERCLFEVANFSPKPRSATLSVTRGTEKAKQFPLKLKKGEVRRIFLKWDLQKLKDSDSLPPIRASLKNDDLQIDDEVQLFGQPSRQIRVRIDLSDAEFKKKLEKAIKASGQARLTTLRPHLLITDKLSAEAKASTWVVQFLQDKDAVSYQGPFLTDKAHPLLRGLSLEGVAWGAGKSERLRGNPVIMAGNVTLVSDEIKDEDSHFLRVRYFVDYSTLTETPAWPVFIWNLLTWRSSQLPGLNPTNVRLGETATLTTTGPQKTINVTKPDQETVNLSVKNKQAVLLPEQVGKYQLHLSDTTYPLACNALSAKESQLLGCKSGYWGGWDEQLTVAGMQNISWIFLFIAALVLCTHAFLVSRYGKRVS